MNPRDLVPESNMPRYTWLADTKLDGKTISGHLEALRTIGVPYTDQDIAGAAAAVDGKTELTALIAYLQGLGIATKRGR